MPVKPNVMERTAFFTLNAAPTPLLDLAGALGYQALSTAVNLNLFSLLQESPATTAELAQRLDCQERGLQKLLEALVAIDYVKKQNGHYANTQATKKWFFDTEILDLGSLMVSWDAFFVELWPHAPQIVRTGKRPFDFYDFVERDAAFSHAFQQTMIGNANIMGPDVVKKISLPKEHAKLLDVGGGHGKFTIQFCEANPQLRATIVDSASALETARQNVADHNLDDRIELCPADIWEMDWGQDFDLILLFNFIHHFDIPTNLALLSKVHAALKPGGQVAILDQLEGAVSGSATNAIVRLVGLMYYIFADGRTFSRDEVKQMLDETGFGEVRFHSSAKWAGTSLVTAVKGD